MPVDPELATHFLQELIRIDTTNPPGNELPAAEYIAGLLRKEGLQPAVLESAPGRGSVVVRLCQHESLSDCRGAQDALLLMSHLDVVPADAGEWTHPPFAAEVADGYVWGRGACDTKGLTAVQLALLITLKRDGTPLRRDIVFAATADEETGGECGMAWLVRHHPHLLDCRFAINEGGGFGLKVGGKHLYLVQTGEKGVCWMRLTVTGTPGHGSMPREDNAIARLCTALARMSRAHLPQHRTVIADRLVRSVANAQRFQDGVKTRLLLNPLIEPLIQSRVRESSQVGSSIAATLRNTVSPTVLRAGSKTNVIPGEATAEVDGRLMPGQTPQDLLREIRPYIGDDVRVDFLTQSKGYESDPASPLFDVFQQVLSEHDPGSVAVPYIVPGGTDGRFLAERDVKVYGFHPLRQEPGINMLEMAHARDERISVANLEFGTAVLYDVVRRFCE
jgi:acetylornithine deacetylase/succinyl-diaminopimelate desuccinylase-like protein